MLAKQLARGAISGQPLTVRTYSLSDTKVQRFGRSEWGLRLLITLEKIR